MANRAYRTILGVTAAIGIGLALYNINNEEGKALNRLVYGTLGGGLAMVATGTLLRNLRSGNQNNSLQARANQNVQPNNPSHTHNTYVDGRTVNDNRQYHDRRIIIINPPRRGP